MPDTVTITRRRKGFVAGTVDAFGRSYAFERNGTLLTLLRPSNQTPDRMVPMASRHARAWRELVERKLATMGAR